MWAWATTRLRHNYSILQNIAEDLMKKDPEFRMPLSDTLAQLVHLHERKSVLDVKGKTRGFRPVVARLSIFAPVDIYRVLLPLGQTMYGGLYLPYRHQLCKPAALHVNGICAQKSGCNLGGYTWDMKRYGV
jgi:hypothetical protein